MKYYSGLDISLKTTFISVVDENGQVVLEQEVASEEKAIGDFLRSSGLAYTKIGLESGQLSIPLTNGLRAQGFDVTCVDARHMAAALSARINKNDRNDARGIAQMMRVNLYKSVHIKSDNQCQIKVLLGSRRALVHSRQQLKGTIRGLLKIWGIRLSTSKQRGSFANEVTTQLNTVDTLTKQSIDALLNSVKSIEAQLHVVDNMITQRSKTDKRCQRLLSVPGVGPIVALHYLASIDDEQRFAQSESVGAYLGLTPRQYASGEVDRHGCISKLGSSICRSMLYEAGFSILTRSKQTFKLRSWGLGLAKKKDTKKAAVALARKLAVIMHRMLVDDADFCYSR